MVPALASLLLALAGPGPVGDAPAAPAPRADGPAGAPTRLADPDDVKRLCASLAPVERLRVKGDAVARGDAERAHDVARDRALAGRYEASVPAATLGLAYDAGQGVLALVEPAQLPIAEGTARLWPALDSGLPVEVDAATARRLVEAQRAGLLVLRLEFALPDDAACGTGARGTRFTLPVEPIAWRWTNSDTAIAAGGAAAERPLATAALGARPRVTVGAPVAGPAEARRRVADRASALEACYGEALRRAPALDGVIVAHVGGGRAAIAADSVGDAELAACVVRAIGPAGGAAGAVPIRFELVSAKGAGSPGAER
ncbi:hypothetical protein [Anaeromyxobacter terrae]|uniref:hypothetical protein n=1 Tax=Anaeromyxobacter terrae TaxID=2925406 RepID=UPI001F56D395|nr:hypothetical protein [Anaeromyxobacter sp. SG22]